MTITITDKKIVVSGTKSEIDDAKRLLSGDTSVPLHTKTLVALDGIVANLQIDGVFLEQEMDTANVVCYLLE